MRIFLSVLCILIFAGPLEAGEIREFDLKTREKLGQQLFRQDSIAARAEDLVAAQFPDKAGLPMKGWITELGPKGDTVYLIMEKDAKYALAFSVLFPLVDPPVVTDRRGEPLPESVALRWKARRTALAAANGKIDGGINYNFEVLGDPTAPGFLVYALVPSNNPREIVVAGHYRISVSADGSKVTKVDALSRGYMKQERMGPAGEEIVGVSVSQLTSNIPVETFIYTSEVYRLPFYVVTGDRGFWKVESGRMTKLDPEAIKAAAEAEEKGSK